ncbi:AAA family ATPase [Lactiplantibacillus plantarum]|uniref:AAA family ATPase n=1 Tax=Lactiplantibacillus plantarum TaxID=1590 RepID=UPI001D0724DD|nr:AAA family ATPase [Lactiplantibacillus plantarum]MCB7178153.1 AAA family ATPase [Lactiplantibacillus plantarum]
MLDMRFAMRQIDLNIKEQIENKKMIAFTSTDNTLGQSTLIANLGMLYARQNKNVLIVDTDSSRDSFPEAFNFTQDQGLYNYFEENDRDISQFITNIDSLKKLSILSAGTVDGSVANEILSKVDFSGLLGELADLYDYIFINVQENIGLDSVMHILKLADGIILTSEENLTRKKKINQLIRQLIMNDLKVMGYINVKRVNS